MSESDSKRDSTFKVLGPLFLINFLTSNFLTFKQISCRLLFVRYCFYCHHISLILNMTTQCFLKYQSFNVEGLNSKLKDETSIGSIKKFDFISLVETWLPANPSINIEGYYCYNRSRIKSKQARQKSGGISVLVKKP